MQRFNPKGMAYVLYAAGILLVVACAPMVPIREVANNPREYAGEAVTLEGDVSAVYSLVVFKYFELSDGTGTIGVVSNKPLPRKGEHVRVTGRLEEAFSLGDFSMTVLIEGDSDRNFIGDAR